MAGAIAKVLGGILLGMVSAVVVWPMGQILGLVGLIVFTMGLADLVRLVRSR